MVSLVTNIATVRKYMKVAFVNQSAMMPDFEAAQKKYVIPILGKVLYQVMETESLTMAEEPTELLKLVLRAVIPLAYFNDLAMVATQITDMGVGVTQATHFQNAPRWQFLELKKNLEDKGCAALEELLIYLNEDKPEETVWTIPDNYDLLLNTGKAFNQYYPISQPYRTFESIRPLAKAIETDVIIPLIGEEYFNILKTKATPTALEKQVIQLVKKAIAYLTIKVSAELLPVNISADGFTVSLSHNNDQPNQGQQQAESTQMSVLVNSCDAQGKSYLSMLSELLNGRASTTIFPEYFLSTFYKASVVISLTDKNQCNEGYLEWPERLNTGLIDIDWEKKDKDRDRKGGSFFL